MLKNKLSDHPPEKPIHKFFEPKPHVCNYELYISPTIKSKLKRMWYPEPDNKNDPDTYNKRQLFVIKTNSLFRKLEKEGPIPDGYKITIDKHHGKCNKTNIQTSGFHHTHISDGNPTFVVMWVADKKKKRISIVEIGVHENFNYNNKVDVENLLEKAEPMSYKK
mgnify:CR=1 FL=1